MLPFYENLREEKIWALYASQHSVSNTVYHGGYEQKNTVEIYLDKAFISRKFYKGVWRKKIRWHGAGKAPECHCNELVVPCSSFLQVPFYLTFNLSSFINDSFIALMGLFVTGGEGTFFSLLTVGLQFFFCICWIAFLLLQIYSASQFFFMTDRKGLGRFQPQEEIMSVSIVLSRDPCMHAKRHPCFHSALPANQGWMMQYCVTLFYTTDHCVFSWLLRSWIELRLCMQFVWVHRYILR